MTAKSALTAATSNVKKAWNKSKGTIAVVSTLALAGTVAIALRAGSDFNAFLNQKGLTDEYYADEPTPIDALTAPKEN